MFAKQSLRNRVAKKSFVDMLRSGAQSAAHLISEHLKLTALIAVAVFLIKTERDRASEIRDQQAEVSAGVGIVNYPIANQLYVPHVVIYNDGKTTAYRVGGKIFIMLGPPGRPDPTFDAEGFQSHHLVDIPAKKGQVHSQAIIPPEMGSDAQRLEIQNEKLADVMAGKLNLWVYGGANYTTEFGDQGWVSYCYLLQPNLRDVFTCAGDRNQVRIKSKTWMQTLVSALPSFSRKDR